MKHSYGILDNKSLGNVVSELKGNIAIGCTLSVVSALFSLYAYDELKKELSKINNFRLLVPRLNDEESFLNNLHGNHLDRRLRNRLDVTRIARECSEWLKQKCEVRQLPSSVHQNLIHLAHADNGEHLAIVGSSSFTTDGLGIVPSEAHHMNTCFRSSDEAHSLIKWFGELWDSGKKSDDFGDILQEALALIYSDKTPQLIYFLTLFNIFRDFIAELEEDKIIKTQTGIKSTQVWQKLYKFQRDGVLGAIDKIERYNGCIIADSVGLGKTFEALAIIKYYELRNDRVLVLCPKKLRENWTLYTVNDKRNIMASDRFNYDVLNHTDLTRLRGMSGEINLETLNWGNYDLIVIDESHNFRNNPARKDDSLTRYSKLMNDIIKAGVKTKVLMLSATPVNNRMNDLKNQVAFIVEAKDEALKSNGIASIEQTLKMAQTRFNAWLTLDGSQRTTESLLETLNFDYFKLLDLLTIARSRKHIEKYYDMSEIGKFPERLRPVNIKADIDTEGRFPALESINRDIRLLNLSAYAPLKYVLPHKAEEYSRKYDRKVAGGSVFRQVDREQSLIHLMRVNLFKRMESSINSFTMTLEKLLGEVNGLIQKIAAHDNNAAVEEFDIEEIEIEDDAFSPFVVGKKVKVLIQDMDKVRWKQELEEDREILEKLISSAQAVKAPQDEKLRRLKELIQHKVTNPINPGNKKIIIFTAFADTAKYLYEHTAKWAHRELGVYSALVTGSGENKTEMPGIRKDLAAIITSFSPISKERDKIDSALTAEIDLLIATDCISEGQNLQDCDYLINYDIHWNPVRIIQRFGRVDRLGSKNDKIQLVNFWPNMELDEYINLEARVSGRMVLLDISATGEENVIEFTDSGKMNDLDYRRKQLEKLQNEVLDIEDVEGGISITDLTLNDFRMDLSDYIKEHENLLERMPPGAFAVATIDDSLKGELSPGVIFCLKNEGAQTVSDTTYALSPYYLVYVSNDGSVILQFTQTKKILDLLKKMSIHGKSINGGATTRLSSLTRKGSDMSHYRNLLSKAVQALTGAAEERGVESLFSPGGTVISKNSFKGMDDFEVVSYLILLGEEADDAR
ncbi:putative DNA/RNA-dependent helicase, SNF II family domain protein (plasmid) [Desulforapulum autotrophicum HRM2]|uniref:DNA/RNA-dependent helicase, SNF II family domain protein n=1 Tax=Desulforapulum autotrophicum (strain ATCC 43914 / DSM 3382 / VKM B-1955 / HRM2) TaxID=177437 RepID=C0QMN9_DESAH|nr:helicase-related protein [Desulforapulum autotrophicum]ACN18033.1 putative DNA/RNA-dependent helicase, SNF II family domain protein [Desulforapulum autotrophicum HRM2]